MSIRLLIFYQKLIELHNGETINGFLHNIDKHMNVLMRESVLTTEDGQKFKQIRESWIRGNNIKGFRVSQKTLNQTPDDLQSAAEIRQNLNNPKRSIF